MMPPQRAIWKTWHRHLGIGTDIGIGIGIGIPIWTLSATQCKSPLESEVSPIYFSQCIQQLTILSRLMKCLMTIVYLI